MKLMEEISSADLEIKRAAQLSIVELSIGSIGHGMKIPLTGQLLSLNQLAFLLNAINNDRLPISSSFEISSIAGVLKSFSPAGQKLGPMFSITMQGFLFWLSCRLFRNNFVGQIIGAFLLCLWSFIQPLVTYFLIYGFELLNIYTYYEKKLAQDFSFIHQSILFGILLVFTLKITSAIALVIYSLKTKKVIQFFNDEQIQNLSRRAVSGKAVNTPWVGALKDMTRPLFVFSFVLMGLFAWQIDGPMSHKIWISLRPLATAFLLFYLVRSPAVGRQLFRWSQRSSKFNNIYQKAKKALELIRPRG